jgi:hypothetical protein
VAGRRITFGDFVRGSFASLRNGTGMNPLITQRYINAAADERTYNEETLPRAMYLRAAIKAFEEYQRWRASQGRWRVVDGEETNEGRDIQYSDGTFQVKVVSGYSRDDDLYTTDIIIKYLDSPGDLHMHVVFDEQGNMITEHWKQYSRIIDPPR